MVRDVRAILFDLGGTLMDAREPWPPVLERADSALREALRASGIELDVAHFRDSLQRYHAVRDRELQETTYHLVLRELLVGTGYTDVSEPVIRAALDAMFSVTQENWALRAGATAALQDLSESGYRLAIISNAGDDKDVQDLVTKFGIRGLFDFVLTSAACSFRKPHPRIFELALAHWTLDPAEAAMVGDTLDADVAGAKRAGIYAIWLAPPEVGPVEFAAGLEPDTRLVSLGEIGEHLRTLSREARG